MSPRSNEEQEAELAHRAARVKELEADIDKRPPCPICGGSRWYMTGTYEYAQCRVDKQPLVTAVNHSQCDAILALRADVARLEESLPRKAPSVASRLLELARATRVCARGFAYMIARKI